MPEPWDAYLVDYHDANPGITEDCLSDARDDAGRSPYGWLVEAVPQSAATVVDVACGSGPVARLLAGATVVGVDQSAGELSRASGPRVQARACALPLADARVDAVVSSMALMLLHPLEALLGEVARLLRPGGTFVATLPTRSASSPVFVAILRELDQVGLGYPEPLDGDDVAERFGRAGLQLVGDESVQFARVVRRPEDAEHVVRSFYAPGAGDERVAAAVATLRRAAPVAVGYRIRRLVARR